MVIFPAIDLRRGRVVRLRQGRAEAETVYDDDPVAVARRWTASGAQWLHIVDLDGAFSGSSGNLEAVRAIVGEVPIPCQFGGGIRDEECAEAVLALGVRRVIFGTVAVEKPEIIRRAVERFGSERVVVGIDARDGRVAVRGWADTTETAAIELARRMRELGVRRVIYTDIRRDGTSVGPNVAATVALARASGLTVIASGGVRTVEDVRRLAHHEADGIEGVIIGRALYEGTVKLEDALAATG